MTNKERLIKYVEELKDIVLSSFEYRKEIKKLPQELKENYAKIYEKTIKIEEAKEYPLLSELLVADSLVDVLRGFQNFPIDEKWVWSDSYEHAIGEINIRENGVTTMPVKIDGTPIGNDTKHIKIDKIQLSNFRFFIDDEENNSFELNGQNMLLYGENGSGKSSIFKAFELLAKIGKGNIAEEFESNKNIFTMDEESLSLIKFDFTNEIQLEIDEDNTQRNSVDFIKNLSVFKPLLDYKELLKIVDVEKGNLYYFFEQILSDYPIDENKILKNLKEEQDSNYFTFFEKILEQELFDNINLFLEQFEQNFKLTDIEFNFGFNKINLKIEYFDKEIKDYQLFLNEARLSALAMSIYFAIIKKQFTLLNENSLKILVLDDLLISLDMNNRLNLIDILKIEFSNFQIFFFTHDKGFFEILKDKMSWRAYEIYVYSEGEFEKPYIKKSLNYFESAIKHFNEYDYPACANYLRKEVERIKKIVNQNEINGVPVDRTAQIVKGLVKSDDFTNFANPHSTDEVCIGRIRGKLIGVKNNLENAREPSVEINLKEINSLLQRILHPQSHDDSSKPLYKKELQEAIEIIEELREKL